MFDKAQTIIGGVASVFATNGTFYEDVIEGNWTLEFLVHPLRTIWNTLLTIPDALQGLWYIVLLIIFLPLLAALVFDKKK